MKITAPNEAAISTRAMAFAAYDPGKGYHAYSLANLLTYDQDDAAEAAAYDAAHPAEASAHWNAVVSAVDAAIAKAKQDSSNFRIANDKHSTENRHCLCVRCGCTPVQAAKE